MYLTVKQELRKLKKEEYEILKELSHSAKNIYNMGLYNNRKEFF